MGTRSVGRYYCPDCEQTRNFRAFLGLMWCSGRDCHYRQDLPKKIATGVVKSSERGYNDGTTRDLAVIRPPFSDSQQ